MIINLVITLACIKAQKSNANLPIRPCGGNAVCRLLTFHVPGSLVTLSDSSDNAARASACPHITYQHRTNLAVTVFIPSTNITDNVLRLLLKPRLADITTPQLDVQHPLHGAEDLLIGRGGTTLELGHDGGRGVALGRELLLRQGLGLELGARLGDGVADFLADGLGLHDVVCSVDLCESLAFYTGLGGLFQEVLVGCRDLRVMGGMVTYEVAAGVLLLGRDDAAAAHGSIESALALDDCLAGAAAAGADVLADPGYLVPIVRHGG